MSEAPRRRQKVGREEKVHGNGRISVRNVKECRRSRHCPCTSHPTSPPTPQKLQGSDHRAGVHAFQQHQCCKYRTVLVTECVHQKRALSGASKEELGRQGFAREASLACTDLHARGGIARILVPATRAGIRVQCVQESAGICTNGHFFTTIVVASFCHIH